MSHSLTILFFLRTSKTNLVTGEAPIYIRLTVAGQRAEISAKRSVLASKWEGGSGKVKGTREEARTLNPYLDGLRGKLNKLFNKLQDGDEPVTAELLKNHFLDKIARSKTMLEVLEYHNEQVAARVGTDYAPATLKRYRVGLKK